MGITASFPKVCEYDHPSVFDPHFYLNNHPDLEHDGLHNKEAAAQHWCDMGVDEGRQATAAFHTVQYLGKCQTIGSDKYL